MDISNNITNVQFKPFSLIFYSVCTYTILFWSCIGIFLIGLFHELLKSVQFNLEKSIFKKYIYKKKRSGNKQIVDAFMYGLQLICSYILMMSVMTLNSYIVISSLSGCFIGFFFAHNFIK